MEITRESVNLWLRRKNRSREWLADQCGVKVGAVGHYLNTKGDARPIPADHQIIIEKLMTEDLAAEKMKPLHNLVLEFADHEFLPIEKAALSEKLTIREWAKRVLNEAADLNVEEFASHILAFPEIPLLHAAAGAPVASDSDTYAPRRNYGTGRFATQLHGHSMAPRYKDRDIVILRERESLKNPNLKKGEIYLFDIGGEKTLKVYQTRLATQEEIDSDISYQSRVDGKQKVIVLRSLNPEFADIVAKEPITWLGWLDKEDN